jgi:hypothetical protein
MSDGENFIARWSRRKRQATEDVQATQSAPVAPADADADRARDANGTGTSGAGTPVAGSALPEASTDSPGLPFDVASLPPVESITAESDIRAFLAPGVPPELARAALRRVWTADPAIRDFVGLAENAWDFNAPDSISGFGTLEMTDELRREVARIIGGGLASDEDDAPASTSRAGQTSAAAVESPVEAATRTADAGESAAPEEQSNCREQCSEQEPSRPSENEDDNPSAIARGDRVDFAPQYDPAEPDNIQVAVRASHGRALPK